MSKETRTSEGMLIRLEVTDELVVMRYGNIISFGKISHDDKDWIDHMLNTTSLKETADNIFKRIPLMRTVA